MFVLLHGLGWDGAVLVMCHFADMCQPLPDHCLFVSVCFADANRVLAGKAGAIDALVAVMRAHVGNAGVSKQACKAMWNICVDGAFAVDFLGVITCVE